MTRQEEYIQKTVKRIEKDKKDFDDIVKDMFGLTPEEKRFFKDYRLGFTRRKNLAIIQHDGTQWVGSGNDPRNKVYGRDAETVVKQLLGVA